MRLGLVGYGVGGRYFHAPFVVAARDVELAGVVSRSPDRRAELAADFPGVPAYGSLTELLAAGVDAVTITTPPQTRRDAGAAGDRGRRADDRGQAVRAGPRRPAVSWSPPPGRRACR